MGIFSRKPKHNAPEPLPPPSFEPPAEVLVEASIEDSPSPEPDLADRSSVVVARATGYAGVDVVGESYNLKSIARAIGRRPGEYFLRATLVRTPDNKHDSNAVRVDLAGKPAGHIPKDEAPRFHALLRAAERAGVSIETNCRVWYDTEYGERASVRLDMVEPAFAWPVNPIRSGLGLGIWPEGRRLKVSPGPEHTEGVRRLLATAYEPGGCCAYLRIALPPDGGSKLVALFEDHPVGLLSPAASKQMRPAIEAAAQNGREVVAIAEVKGNSLAVDIKLLVAPAEELSEAEIRQITG